MVDAALDFMRGLENDEALQPVDINALLESLRDDARELGAAVAIDGAARGPYRSRPQAMKRCMGNLIDNAVKYGKSATIVVDDGPERLELRVQDQGPGVPAAELERVF